MKRQKNKKFIALLAFSQLAIVSQAFSQNLTPTQKEDSTAKKIDEIIITGVSNPKASVSSSISVSTLRLEQIEATAPRTTAEIFKQIPGIRTESSAGEGNTNISVRGVPLATGGSKYLLLQEDGLPVLQFGDIAFATQDQFIRADATLSRIEAVKGGSASILASNSPAGIINFISKDGRKEGGSITSSVGLDYRNLRTDVEYGTKIGNGLYMHVGGFYRQGEGPRNIGYLGNDGGQIKLNVTKDFSSGYIKFYVKSLRDHTAGYMPMPMSVTGTNDSPTWGSVNGYDASYGALQTPLISSLTALNQANQPELVNVREGVTSNLNSIGSEFKVNLANNWSILGKSRFSTINGRFLAPFPANVGTSSAIASGLVGAGNTALLTYADGTAFNTGQSGNDLLMVMHLFNTKLNNFNNMTNDFSLNKNFKRVKVNVGVYQSTQNINMSWLWNSYLMDVNNDGKSHNQLVNIASVNSTNDTTNLSENGLLAYGVPAWGNCCQRNYDVNYSILAPNTNIDIEVNDNITFSLGARYDMGRAKGTYSGAVVTPVDVDNNGTISPIESNVATINNNHPSLVNYSWNYLSYSVGANYRLKENSALFARYSKGGRAGADRVLFSNYLNNKGGLTSDNNVVDFTSQAELGYKYRSTKLTLNATAFFAQTDEKNYEATNQVFLDRTYQAFGLELEGRYTINKFALFGGLTLTKATISKDVITPANVGKTPRRQAGLIYTITPSYNFNKKLSVGVSIIGTTQSYAQDNNDLVMNGYVYLNPYISYSPAENFFISIQANNVLNAIGVTESEEGSITNNATNVVRARSIAGRSTSITLKYKF
jgi:outer membrane receptor protein involved in Fe transport